MLTLLSITFLTIIDSVCSSPNFLIYYVDDMDVLLPWEESQAGVNLKNYTVEYLDIPVPNIEAFRNEAIVFPRCYAGAPACAPSRFTLLTGRFPSRGEYAQLKTLQESDGSTGTRIIVPYAKLSGDDNTYNLQTTLRDNGYYTAFVGKWHLLPGITCNSLTVSPNETLYNECTDFIKNSTGFDFADAVYVDNIFSGQSPYSHNPEWVLQQAQEAIVIAENRGQSWFLQFANTLTHTPDILLENVLNDSRNVETPKGTLTGDDIPTNTGMKTRSEIADLVSSYGYNDSSNDDHDFAARSIWLDDQFGALIQFLKDLDVYDDTFIIFANDHGQQSKMTLYEQGTRMIQFIRYPPLFDVTDGAWIVPNNFIVSNYDLPAVIFDVANIDIPDGYVMDGESWLNDVQKVFDARSNWWKQYKKSKQQTCCLERWSDYESQHTIVSEEYKYIFRATSEGHSRDEYYEYYNDTEQLYYLTDDPDEQDNLARDGVDIDNDITEALADAKDKMIDYIRNIACLSNDSDSCVVPDAATCTDDVVFTKTWHGVDTDNYDVDALLTEAKEEFVERNTCDLSSFDNIDYESVLDVNEKKKQLVLRMVICCQQYRTFSGSAGGLTQMDRFSKPYVVMAQPYDDSNPSLYWNLSNPSTILIAIGLFVSFLCLVCFVMMASKESRKKKVKWDDFI